MDQERKELDMGFFEVMLLIGVWVAAASLAVIAFCAYVVVKSMVPTATSSNQP